MSKSEITEINTSESMAMDKWSSETGICRVTQSFDKLQIGFDAGVLLTSQISEFSGKNICCHNQWASVIYRIYLCDSLFNFSFVDTDGSPVKQALWILWISTWSDVPFDAALSLKSSFLPSGVRPLPQKFLHKNFMYSGINEVVQRVIIKCVKHNVFGKHFIL